MRVIAHSLRLRLRVQETIVCIFANYLEKAMLLGVRVEKLVELVELAEVVDL